MVEDAKLANEQGQTELTWLEAVRAANAASEISGRDVCYAIHPRGRGTPMDEPPVTWVRNCDGYRLPTRSEAEHLGRSDRFWLWDPGPNERVRGVWPSGDANMNSRREALRFRW